MRTTFIGIRKPFSISSTPIAAAGWKRFLPSIAASTQVNECATFARLLRLRYAASLRRDRVGFVLQRHQPALTYVSLRPHFIENQHSQLTRVQFTAPQPVSKNFFTASRHTSLVTNLTHATQFNSRVHPATSHRPGVIVPQQFHTRTVEREMNHRTTILNRLHSERLEQRSRVETIERTLAREIALRVRRVEQMPQLRSAPKEMRTLPPPAMQVVRQISSAAASASQPVQEFRSAAPPHSPPPLNFDAIAQNVMRHIDNRLCARRERLGRT